MADRDGSQEEGEFSHYYGGNDATIFLIDASVDMFNKVSPEDEEDCPFVQALRCAHNTLRNKIFTAPSDSVAVVLFGTGKTSEEECKYGVYANTYILQDLQIPRLESIQQLEKIWTEPDAMAEFQTAALQSQSLSLGDPFWLCSAIFTKHKGKQDEKNVFLFTNTDRPHSTSSDEFKQAESRVRDLYDSKVTINLLPIGESFDFKKFYRELLAINGDSDTLETTAVTSLTIEDLLSETRRKSYKKRALAKLVLHLSPEVKLGVELYNLVRNATPPKKILLEHKTGEEVKSITTKFNADTGEALLSSEVTKYVTVGGEKVRMDAEEIQTLKTRFPVGLKLLGFKPVGKIKNHLFIDPASFIYPSEGMIKGSKLLFGALLSRCQARGIAAICYLKRTSIAKPRLVALLPSSPEDRRLVGFHVIYLPFRNEIRQFDYEQLTARINSGAEESKLYRALPEQIEAAKSIVKKLKSTYNPDNFEDPTLHTWWSNIENSALGKEAIEPVEDCTLPDHDHIARRLGRLSEGFINLVYPHGFPLEETSAKPKAPVDIGEIEYAAKMGMLDKMRVDQLKGYLSNQEVMFNKSAKKAELIQLVKKHLSM